MADLKTNYVDDELDTTKNQLRKYKQIQNDDGTVSFVDVTEYTKVGTSFGAKDINDTNAAINDVNGKLIWTVICTGVTLRDGYKWFNMDDYNEIYVVIQDDNNVYHPFIIPRNQIIDDPREFGDNVARFRCINGAIAIICNGGMSILCR